MLRIEVCYAVARDPTLIAVEVAEGTTLREAIEQSGIRRRHPEIDLRRFGVGVFGRVRDPDGPIEPGDRIEIYRPLAADPKDMRRTAARKK